MITNENIVCVSSIDWDFIWQGHQEIMAAFAKNGNRVLFIENTGVRVPGLRDTGRIRKRLVNWFKGIKGFREVSKGLYVYSPLIFPFPYSRLNRWVNKNFLFGSLRKWVRVMNFRDAIIWTFLPTGIALDLIDELGCKCLVYYCIADFNKLTDTRRVQKTEGVLIKKSDIIFAQGKTLEEKCRKFNQNVHVFPFGVNTNIFDAPNDLSNKHKHPDMCSIKKPVIGYIGGVHRHIDFDLLAYTAMSNPEWSIVLIGPIQTDVSELKKIPNIIFLGKKDFNLLPGYIKDFDVCIIPYSKSEFTDTVYPTKLNEYHALGKAVVATSLPEISAYNKENGDLVLIANDKEEFVEKIKSALEEKNTDLANARIASARKHSWDVRIEEMSSLVEEVIRKKKISGYSDWQRIFKQVYNTARRRFIKVVFIFFALRFLIFNTPIMWYLASPLKIVNEPQKADAIVVFAGGVGESGKAGQGYEERVDYAVKLYKQGYAGYLIFCSGYKFIFNEAEVMKSLAISLGVPSEAIILEEGAGNTYEYVKSVKEILEKRKWEKALLVTSPYNMGRVSLVVDKIAQGASFIYTPAPSYFYGYNPDIAIEILPRHISLKQIKAIIHEYLGIVYYYFKGYI